MIVDEREHGIWQEFALADPGWLMFAGYKGTPGYVEHLISLGVVEKDEDATRFRLTDLGRSYAVDVMQLGGAR